MEVTSLGLNLKMHFYEIHDADPELGTAVLLMHETDFDGQEFFELVKRARLLVKDAFEEESLSEAIANELERSEGFVHITDDKLIAAVQVDETDTETYLVQSGDATRSIYVESDDSEDPDRSN